jgi:hypothetical protein
VSGYELVALIFVREINDHLAGLVKKIDRQLDETMTKQKRTNKLGVFVIVCTTDVNGTQQKLKELSAKEELKQVVLSTFAGDGPHRYRVAKEAAFTVAVYSNHEKVSANFAMKKGGLDKDKTDAIFKAVTAVLPKK